MFKYLVINTDGSTHYVETADDACKTLTIEWATPARTLRTLKPGDELCIGDSSIVVLTGLEVTV